MAWLDPRRPWARRYGSLVVWLPLWTLLLSPLLLWWLRPISRHRALILDRTVDQGDTREHDSLLWVLRHQKVAARWLGTQEELQIEPGIDWVFATDTYGVYREDTRQRSQERLSGGWSDAELDRLEKYCAAGGNFYAEFNTLAYPTVGEQRHRLERLLGLRFSGWTGRYFKDFQDSEVPQWLRTRLQPATGQGYVLLHEDGRTLTLPGAVSRMNMDLGPYSYWFDVVEAKPGTEVLARYRFDSEAGQIMQKSGIPREFPALLLRQEGGRRLYACGDYSDNPCSLGPYWLEGSLLWNRWRYARSPHAEPRFFWSFYAPFLSSLLDES